MVESSAAERVASLLLSRGETVAVAESSAGGLICTQLTRIAGSSRWFAGGAIAYGNEAKQRLAGVPQETIASFGAASLQTAAAMAHGIRTLLGADWGLAETGIAGPQTGRRSAKPAGLTFVAVCGPLKPVSATATPAAPVTDLPSERTQVEEVHTDRDDRAANQRAFADAALALLVRAIIPPP